MSVVDKRQFQVKWPADDPFSGSWWSKVGDMVDICALGLRDAADKRAVMVLTLGTIKG